jgi:DNA-binding transcriptional regulator YiaG
LNTVIANTVIKALFSVYGRRQCLCPRLCPNGTGRFIQAVLNLRPPFLEAFCLIKEGKTAMSLHLEQELNRIIGINLRKRRTQMGFSQAKVAEWIGITYQQLQKVEAGHNRVSAARLKLLADYLCVPLYYFFQPERF